MIGPSKTKRASSKSISRSRRVQSRLGLSQPNLRMCENGSFKSSSVMAIRPQRRLRYITPRVRTTDRKFECRQPRYLGFLYIQTYAAKVNLDGDDLALWKTRKTRLIPPLFSACA